VHYSIIKILQKKDKDTRKRIATYCVRDTVLPLRLMDNQKTVYNLVEMARVTGVPVNILIKRGQQIKVLS
jgi:DNA polymerase delta subunit 1